MPYANSTPQDSWADLSNREQETYEREQLRALNPSPIPTTAQLETLGRLMRGRSDSNVSIAREPFDLPAGYIVVTFAVGGFTVGIAPDGQGSS